MATFDTWVGQFVGALGSEAADLAAATKELVGPVVDEREGQFIEAVEEALRASGLVAAYAPAGVTGRQLADTLYASARGLKYGAATREAFVEGMSVAARVMCLPQREHREKQANQGPASPRREGGRPRRARGKTR